MHCIIMQYLYPKPITCTHIENYTKGECVGQNKVKATKQDNWRFCLMHYESMKDEQIPIATPMYKAKLERNIDACKSTKHNRSLIRHNRSTIKLKGLSPTKKQAMKIMERRFYDLELFQRNRQFKQKCLVRNICIKYLS